ncbi:MbtH family protein [Rhizobium laguerreae]|nr:MbtH family protein [Rhizobium laguerreae]
MTNPFDSADHEFLALVNDEGQHSLWPATIDVPTGWSTAFGPADRTECLSYIEESWNDIRPFSIQGLQ